MVSSTKLKGTAAYLFVAIVLYTTASEAAFLSNELPLKLEVTTPIDILNADAKTTVSLTGRQTITAVFSRPVIALGSDFGQTDSFGDKVPFTLTCSVPGRFRWVTTYIARFDTDVDWPTDLACNLVWNSTLESYDGVKFQLPPQTSVPLATEPLSFSIDSVTSEFAMNLTGALWSANDGLKDDVLPEVPPDGVIQLQFSYPVNLLQLQSALTVTLAASSNRTSSTINFAVDPCTSSPPVYPLTPTPRPVLVPDYLNTTSACAQISILDDLAPATQYVLTLPKGAKYNSLSGPLTAPLNATFGGLRLFRLPLITDYTQLSSAGQYVDYGVSYRRLHLWLVHGLSPTTRLSDLASAITLCYTANPFTASGARSCTQEPFNLTRLDNGTIQISAPGLMPNRKYTLSVASSRSVRDGYNQSLTAYNTTWWSKELPDVFQGPAISNGASAVFPAGTSLTWPYLVRGNSGQFAGYWALDASEPTTMTQVLALLSNSYQAAFPSPLGRQDGSLRASSSSSSLSYRQQQLTLSGSPQQVYLVHTCCNSISWPFPRNTSTSLTIVSASSLVLSVISGSSSVTAWLADLGGQAGPVAGGNVTIYRIIYEAQTTATVLGSCLTGADGSCQVDLPTGDPYFSAQLSAVAVSGSRAAMLPSAMWVSSSSKAPYVGTLVLDRALVKPGDRLHVTGYLQEQQGAELVLPQDLLTVTLEISPNFDAQRQYEPFTVQLQTDPSVGSVHGAIAIPDNASRTQYSISMQVGDQSVGGSASFTVSDPRPPTAALTVTAPKWSKPDAAIPISVKAVSYIGADVSGANMTVTWSAGSNAQGVLYIVTGDNGTGRTTIDLGKLPAANATQDGDTLSVNVEWIGPTRERIVETASTSLADSSRELYLATTPGVELPSLPFLVKSSLSDIATGKDLTGVPVTVTLSHGNDSDCPSDPPGSCTIVTGDFFNESCTLTLPCMGTFTLKACTSDDQDNVACTNITLGRNETSWQQLPWFKQPELSVTPFTGPVALGGTARMLIMNPWQGAVAFMQWGNGFEYKHKLVEQVPEDAAILEFPVGRECLGGCSVTVVLVVGANPFSADHTPQVPTSKLFDPRAGFTDYTSASFELVQDNTLDVSLDLGSDSVLTPGAQASWSVSVTKDGDPIRGAEVTLIAVDKAILDLIPYPLQDPAAAMKAVIDSYQQVSASDGSIAPGALAAVFDTAVRRSLIDPWVSPDTSIIPAPWSSYASAVDQSDEDYFKPYYTDITLFPGRGFSPVFLPNFADMDTIDTSGPRLVARGPVPTSLPTPLPAPLAMPETLPMEGSGSASSSAGAQGASVRAQGQFSTTALFRVFKTTSGGSGNVTFEAPVNLGTFVVRAYAATGDAQYGGTEEEVVVRRVVSLTPSIPRFVRVGDSFEGGVLVTLAASAGGPASITVTVEVEGSPLRLGSPPSSRTVTLGATSGDQTEVRFAFDAVAIGSASLTFKASDGEGASDALQLDLSVEAQQGPVVVATSFVVAGNGSSASGQWKEGLALPSAVPGSGSLDLTLGVGYLPAIQAIDKAVSTYSPKYPEAGHALAVATLPPALASYGSLPSNKTSVSHGSRDLKTLTTVQYGLQYSDPLRWGWTLISCPITLNAQASYLVSSYPSLPTSSPYRSDWSSVSSLAPTWRTALAAQITRDAVASRAAERPAAYSDLDTLAWARLALGARWTPPPCARGQEVGSGWPPCASAQVVDDLSLRRLMAALPSLSLQSRLLLGLVLAPSPALNPGNLTAILGLTLSALRVQGQTAYVAAETGSASPASLLDQSLALALLTATAITNQLVPKLAAYVAAGQVAAVYTDVVISADDITQAFRVSALSGYDRLTASTAPQLDVEVVVGDMRLINASFHGGNADEVVSSSTPWEDLPAPPPPLRFKAEGTGQVSVAASLTFVPSTLLAYPSYRGIWVEAIIRGQDPATALPTGPALSTVPLSSVVTVTVQVTSPDDLGATTLEVWLPGGLEAVDPNVASDSGAATSCSLGESLGSYRPYWWWWPVCPAQETFTDMVVFRWQYLSAGTSSVQFLAVAASVGDFVLPPIKAYATQQPEVMGMTAGGDFTVCAPPCTAVAAGLQPPAKACPDDCNGNGVCNIAKGQCVCNPGFGSDNCSQLESS